jgi:hypothetical protein
MLDGEMEVGLTDLFQRDVDTHLKALSFVATVKVRELIVLVHVYERHQHELHVFNRWIVQVASQYRSSRYCRGIRALSLDNLRAVS